MEGIVVETVPDEESLKEFTSRDIGCAVKENKLQRLGPVQDDAERAV